LWAFNILSGTNPNAIGCNHIGDTNGQSILNYED